MDQEYNLNLKQINKGIKDKYGIIELKEKVEDKKIENDDEEVEKETQKGEDEEDDEDLYLENW